MSAPIQNLCLICALLPGFVSAANAGTQTTPVPFYNSNIVKTDRIGAGSIVIQTKDSSDTVHAWYQAHLRDANGETKTEGGGYILYTHNGATVDIEPGNRFDHSTSIGLVWDSKKYGTFDPLSGSARSGRVLRRE
ncbi:MAG TPA: hypothetical protein VHU23_08905 [Rhizomicrobium sp.]|jgi:hypothetical protein|nr:hypothetical protein [Rhizomicrobium sp.]